MPTAPAMCCLALFFVSLLSLPENWRFSWWVSSTRWSSDWGPLWLWVLLSALVNLSWNKNASDMENKGLHMIIILMSRCDVLETPQSDERRDRKLYWNHCKNFRHLFSIFGKKGRLLDNKLVKFLWKTEKSLKKQGNFGKKGKKTVEKYNSSQQIRFSGFL